MVWQAVHCGNGFTKKISICFDGYSVDQEFGALVLEIFPPQKNTHNIKCSSYNYLEKSIFNREIIDNHMWKKHFFLSGFNENENT